MQAGSRANSLDDVDPGLLRIDEGHEVDVRAVHSFNEDANVGG